MPMLIVAASAHLDTFTARRALGVLGLVCLMGCWGADGPAAPSQAGRTGSGFESGPDDTMSSDRVARREGARVERGGTTGGGSPQAAGPNARASAVPEDAGVSDPVFAAAGDAGALGDAGRSLEGAGGEPGTRPERDMAGELMSVIHDGARFVAVGTYPRTNGGPGEGDMGAWIITSEDGKNWTERYRDGSELLYSVAHSEETWVAAGWGIWNTASGFQRSRTVVVSDDGLSWRRANAPEASHLTAVVWTGEEFLLLGEQNREAALWASPDGESWAARTLPPSTSPWDETVLVAGSPGVVLSADSQVSLTSDGGRTWTTSTLPVAGWPRALWATGEGFSGIFMYDCCFGEVPGGQTYYEVRSVDGIEWTATMVPEDQAVGRPAVLDEMQAAVHVNGPLAVRANGEQAWVLSDERYFEDVVAADVLVAAGAWLLRWSEDGRTWHVFESLE